MLHRRLLLTLAVAAVAAGCTAPPATAAGRLVQVQIVDRASDRVLDEHSHRALSYVAGRPGDRYAVRLANRSAGRVLVVLSVDGVNAITGETATTGQTGYVLAPWQSADITGWRKSNTEAAAFYFTALPDSYAARTDRPDNVGVIGVAVFRERVQPPPAMPFEPARPDAGPRGRDEGTLRERPSSGSGPEGERRASADGALPRPWAGSPAPAPARAEQAAGATIGRSGANEASDARATPPAPAQLARADRLGTGHGEREWSPIRRTTFERSTSQPVEVVQVRYDSLAHLVAAGVVTPPRWSAPDPFPGYAPDPR